MSKQTNNPDLRDYQQRIRQLVVERGFDTETVSEVFTLLVEEVGELAKAIRKTNGQKVSAHSHQHEAADELADIFWLLIDLCNRLDVDLSDAFEAKERKNQARDYQ
ncbi:MAG: MazG nucleotide pyrophosphohydrolase domain-containing protein [Candidatus Saccharimonadales bacterium]